MVAVLTASPTRSKVRPHVGTASSRRYERRRPEKTPLYKIVAEHLEGWLENRAVARQPVLAHVDRELRSYLTCPPYFWKYYALRVECYPPAGYSQSSATMPTWPVEAAT